MIKISIIIPAYNEQETIIELLEKVFEQNIESVELQVIVIDDGSTDNTLRDALVPAPVHREGLEALPVVEGLDGRAHREQRHSPYLRQ